MQCGQLTTGLGILLLSFSRSCFSSLNILISYCCFSIRSSISACSFLYYSSKISINLGSGIDVVPVVALASVESLLLSVHQGSYLPYLVLLFVVLVSKTS